MVGTIGVIAVELEVDTAGDEAEVEGLGIIEGIVLDVDAIVLVKPNFFLGALNCFRESITTLSS